MIDGVFKKLDNNKNMILGNTRNEGKTRRETATLSSFNKKPGENRNVGHCGEGGTMCDK